MAGIARFFRPRFSIRTLAIFVTLVCAYFGAWEATKRYGTPQVIDDHWQWSSSPVPFLVRRDELPELKTHYYLWQFGSTFKLPIESEWKPPATQS